MPHWGSICSWSSSKQQGSQVSEINYFDDSQFHMLQLYLMDRPDAGDIIKGSGGVRKLRWGLQGSGKRGGVRVIYYWITKNHQVLFLTAYAKNEASGLSRDAIKAMREIVKDL